MSETAIKEKKGGKKYDQNICSEIFIIFKNIFASTIAILYTDCHETRSAKGGFNSVPLLTDLF